MFDATGALGSQYPQTWCIACGRDVEQEKIHLEAAKKLVLERAQWQYKKMKKISEPAAKIVQAKGYIPIEMPGVVLLESDMPLFKAYVSTMVEYKHLDADITAASAQNGPSWNHFARSLVPRHGSQPTLVPRSREKGSSKKP